MNLKVIGLSALINAALTVILSIFFFPLLFLGPLIGGFLASYLSKGYEDYEKMDKIDGLVVGAISGIIGGIIMSLLFILGIGDINVIIELISTKIGTMGNNGFIMGYIILQFSVIMSFILGLVGGIIGVTVKK